MPHFATRPALIAAAVAALERGLTRAARTPVTRWPGYPAYVAEASDNLLKPELLERFRSRYDAGAGGELKEHRRGRAVLPPKMHAVRSSSALALNAFGPWADYPGRLVLGSHTGFGAPAFEEPLEAIPTRHPPHLDVFLRSEREVIGVEVKCLEYLSPPKNGLASAYHDIPTSDPRRRSSWFRHMKELGESTYSYLHAAQLVKHYFGLAQFRRPTGMPVTLLYLYWLPSNWSEITVAGGKGSVVNPFLQHEREVQRFAEAVKDDRETGIAFESMGTLELFAQWGNVELHPSNKEHLGLLRARYEVPVETMT